MHQPANLKAGARFDLMNQTYLEGTVVERSNEELIGIRHSEVPFFRFQAPSQGLSGSFGHGLERLAHANLTEGRFDAVGGRWRIAFAFDPERDNQSLDWSAF